MSMQEFPDDSLDELFRKSAEEFEPAFDPQAWAAMRKKLDNNDGIQKRPALLSLLLLLLIIFGCSVGGYLLWPQLTALISQNSVNTSTVRQQNPTSSSSIVTKSAKQSDGLANPLIPSAASVQDTPMQSTDRKTGDTQPVESPSVAHSAEKRALTPERTVPSSAGSSHNKKAQSTENNAITSAGTASGNNETPESVEENADPTRKKLPAAIGYSSKLSSKRLSSKTGPESTPGNLTPSDLKTKNRLASKSVPKTDQRIVKSADQKAKNDFTGPSNTLHSTSAKKGTEESILSDSKRSVSAKPTPTALSSDATMQTDLFHRSTFTPNALSLHPWKFLNVAYAPVEVLYTAPAPPLAIAKKPEMTTSAAFKKGLNIRILAAPDLSFIGFDQMKRPGITYGALVEYRFNNRFSLQAGAIRAMKLYDALGSQYIWPQNWYSQKARPVNIEASCKVLDIPINLRYDITQSANRRWFVSTGISSYKMLNEKYIYTYAPHTYGIKWYNWEGSTGDYWFGVLNLSMGFERQLGKRFTLQAEPYFKVPLAQVGLGQIKLNTAGIYISTRYRLGRF